MAKEDWEYKRFPKTFKEIPEQYIHDCCFTCSHLDENKYEGISIICKKHKFYCRSTPPKTHICEEFNRIDPVLVEQKKKNKELERIKKKEDRIKAKEKAEKQRKIDQDKWYAEELKERKERQERQLREERKTWQFINFDQLVKDE